MNFLTILSAINMEYLLKSLDIMWKGVVAIFVVIALVIVVTWLMNKLCLKIENRKKDDEKNE